ncbi:MAG: stage II sporulation protein P, partial [Firmicutes bacterium]|nr:stage II sporulation protein P [Bacillota bacterium]
MIKRRLIIATLIAALMTGAAGPPPASAGQEAEHMAGVCYKFYTQDGRLVTMTSRKPYIGDGIITPEGLHYKVDRVRGNTARVKLLGRDNRYLALEDYYAGLESVPTFARRWNNRPVAIYHTHTDESYLPTDGDFSIPFKGGIYQVGETFHSSLEREQIDVLYDRTPHCPHDANAYYRSRRTAVRLMKKNPLAMFDVHRDGVNDPEFYRRIVSTKNVTQMRLVVGRQNPKMEANLDFAKRLLAFGEKQHPGLLKEIYMARGNYNQDLLSTALLIEAGTYTNEKWQAQGGISMLADIVPTVLGLEPPAEGITGEDAGRQGWKTALFLILLLTVAFAGFVVINIPGVNA